jgi:hypothetical protein
MIVLQAQREVLLYLARKFCCFSIFMLFTLRTVKLFITIQMCYGFFRRAFYITSPARAICLFFFLFWLGSSALKAFIMAKRIMFLYIRGFVLFTTRCAFDFWRCPRPI